MLRAAVVPNSDAVGLPAPAHLVLWYVGLHHQIAQQIGAAGVVVLAIADVGRRVKVGEVGGKAVDVEDFFARLGVRAHHRMLGIWKLRVQSQAFFHGHSRAKGGLNAVPRPQRRNLLLHMGR